MSVNPGSPGFAMPPQEDDEQRRQRDLERQTRENAAARSLAASQIGNGGTLLINGSLQVTGTLTVPGTLSSAGAVSAGTTVSAGTSVTAGTSLNATTDVNAVNANLTGYVFSPAGRAFQVVTSFASAWFDGAGKLGINTSTVNDKQDFEPADTSEIVDALLHVAFIRFRRTDLVEQIGDAAPYELGTIAEYMAGTPLREWVFTDVEGAIQGIEWAHLVIPLIATVQSLDARLKRLEEATQQQR